MNNPKKPSKELLALLEDHTQASNLAASARMCGLGELARTHQENADELRAKIREMTDGK
mgnify:CR=1 FL=1